MKPSSLRVVVKALGHFLPIVRDRMITAIAINKMRAAKHVAYARS
jgi:hypothetical protein